MTVYAPLLVVGLVIAALFVPLARWLLCASLVAIGVVMLTDDASVEPSHEAADAWANFGDVIGTRLFGLVFLALGLVGFTVLVALSIRRARRARADRRPPEARVHRDGSEV